MGVGPGSEERRGERRREGSISSRIASRSRPVRDALRRIV